MLVNARTARVRLQAGRARAPRRGSCIPRSGTVANGALYDSDSFENHVIDLEGDEEQSSSAEEKEEMEQTETIKTDMQCSEMVVGNQPQSREGVADAETISVPGASNLIGGALSNGEGSMGHKRVDTGESMEGHNGGTANQHPQQFSPGQLVWAKFARFPWWPAQVMSSKDTEESVGGRPASDTDVLVRFFGTYDYGWVDPIINLSDFDVKLVERKRIRKRALQKGIEEALAYKTSGTLPTKWEAKANGSEQKKGLDSNSNGVEGGKAAQEQESEHKRPPRKRKPKVLFKEEDIQRKPERTVRRLRIMRQLGLVAPAGSPFTLDSRL